jgi:hypothetical protein
MIVSEYTKIYQFTFLPVLWSQPLNNFQFRLK